MNIKCPLKNIANSCGRTSLLIFLVLKSTLLFPQSESELNSSARKKYQTGNLSGAIADYSAIIGINPRNDTAYYERGRIFTEQKKFVEALNDFAKAIEINPKNYKAYYLSGYAKYLAGNHRGALSDLSASIDIYPNSALAFWYRAEAKMNLGDKKGACEDWDKAYRLGYFEATQKIKLNCSGVNLSSQVTADSFLRQGDAKLDKGDAAGALADYRKASELEPQSGMIMYSIGLAKIVLNDTAGACEAWTLAVKYGSPEAQEMLRQHCR
jgi:tetratricopeptide (TPR) repeat protein